MSIRYFIRLGNLRGRGPYVATYAGGDVTTVRRRCDGALFWIDPLTAKRLARAIRKVDGRSARVTAWRSRDAN